MGVKYAEGVILDVEGMWQESKIRVPMICLLSMGSDPTMTIDGLAKKHQIGKLSRVWYMYSMLYTVIMYYRMSHYFHGPRTGSTC